MTTDAQTSSTSVTPSVPSPKPIRDRFEQDQTLANALSEAARLIQTARTTPELSDVLAGMGFDANELNAGMTLVQAAQAKFAARQSSLATLAQARTAREDSYTVARDDFAAYRTTVQVNYKGPSRAALGADGKISMDKERFVSNARGAYTAGRLEPHGSVLAKNGFNDHRFNQVTTNLEAFAASDAAFKLADRNATRSTAERDEAAASLETWVQKFRKLAKVALKRRPDLRAALGI